ncbi:cation/cationic drug transporter [Desulfitobacterium dehalogenans ATCC 51507]|uniref:Cation/cationic drug transporter n=1 Tax=Desulfitobacterium dehalogenans (strain ATCC 51507 / DSM 9161 / JW/IU-DC1) TaxID=756499 RepID=I4ABQ2_DESDJ|nr:multidrug efflux SMR transporter [Desulfitobacterium dehalogenans]AFM01387.1 cation/cationic drug transporter [Desulfitobacterium dehalogenans ATCC 51507]
MNKIWASVVIAAFFEVCWVIGLKHAEGIWEWGGTLIAIIISFYLMIMAARNIAVGTVYAVFVGLGTAGTVLAEILLFNAPVIPAKLALIVLLLSGVVSLKLLSNQKEKEVR